MKKVTKPNYSKQVNELIKKLDGLKESIFKEAIGIIEDIENYSVVTLIPTKEVPPEIAQTVIDAPINALKKGIECVKNLIFHSGDDEKRRLQTLVDLLNEDCVSLYPFILLKYEAAEQLEKLNRHFDQL